MGRKPIRTSLHALWLAASLAGVMSSCTPQPEQSLRAGEPDEACPESPLRLALRQSDERRLRVLVSLTGDIPPAGETEDAERRRAIAALQERLVTGLQGTDSRVLRRYDNLPQLALRVDEAGLCRLLVSPLVRSVEIDRATPPGAVGAADG
jgi:hypothetical protein